MKLLNKFKNKNYNAENRVYQFQNGVRLVYTYKPDIKDVDLDIIFLAGSYFEKQIGVPNGTTHFLEHMMMNPNGKFKTQKDIEEFTFGNSRKPTFFKNASTYKKYIRFYTYGHTKSLERQISFLGSVLQYPEERFKEFIDNEREVILSEERSEEKIEKDILYNFNKFLVEEFAPDLVDRIIGTEESIKSITIDHLVKAKKEIFKSHNAIISIQTSLKPEAKILKRLESLANKIPKGKVKFKILKENVVNKYKSKYFVNEKAQGVEIAIGRLRPVPPKNNYKRFFTSYFFYNLIYYMSYMYLRNVKGLIYGVHISTALRSFRYTSTIISFNVDKSKFSLLLNELVVFIKSKLLEFLDSKDGVKWLQGQISKYIFTTTINYDCEYALDIAMQILTNQDYKWDFKLAQKVAKSMTTDAIKDRVKEFLVDSPLFIWIESPFEEKEVMGIYKKSKLYKELSKRK